MNGEQLGKYFVLYAAQQKPTPMKEGETFAFIYGDDDYVIDHEKCLLHFPDIAEPIGLRKAIMETTRCRCGLHGSSSRTASPKSLRVTVYRFLRMQEVYSRTMKGASRRCRT